MIETLPILRVCAACEAEDGSKPGPYGVASHGLCRRHFITALRHAGCPEEEIAEALVLTREHDFCADWKTEASTINSGPGYDRPDAPD